MSEGLRAGAARVDITPRAEGTFLAGFAMGRRSKGVHMPLYATAVYVSDGTTPLVLVSLDLVGLLKVWIDRIRARVTSVPGAAVVVACTHTHAGPDTMGYWGPSLFGVFPRSDGKEPAYMHALVDNVARAIDDAVAAAQPATLRVASFDVDPRWTRNDRTAGGRFDHALALAVDGARGGRIATILNYASHPEALWEQNQLISPDFIGPLRARLEADAGGAVAYFSGPLGAMLTPNVPKDADPGARRAYIEEMGAALARATRGALDEAPVVPAPGVTHATRAAVFANANWRFRLLERLGLVDVVTDGREVRSAVHTVAIGPARIVTAPGEVCPELGARIWARVPGAHRGMICLCEDEFGYMLEPAMFDDVAYRYERSMSLGRGTADRLISAFGDFLEGGA